MKQAKKLKSKTAIRVMSKNLSYQKISKGKKSQCEGFIFFKSIHRKVERV